MSGVPTLPNRPERELISNPWWNVRRPTSAGPDRDHDVQISSRRSILWWAGLGIALLVLGVWMFSRVWPVALGIGILSLGALGTAFGKWRQNRWLRPPTR